MERFIGIFFAAIVGAVLGSFANVLVLRWHEEASLLGRSQCPGCKAMIRPRHLVPIISWLWLRGRCAYCDRKIHVQYPIVESVAVLFGIIAALRWDPVDPMQAFHFWFEFILTISLIVPVAMDIRWSELPVEYMATVGILSFAAQLYFGTPVVGLLLAIGVAVCFFGLQIIVSRGKWVGMGDVWFGGMMGAALGWPLTGAALYIAYVLGGGIALAGLISGRYTRKDRLPFAPMLAAGTLACVWYGGTISSWITHVFL